MSYDWPSDSGMDQGRLKILCREEGMEVGEGRGREEEMGWGRGSGREEGWRRRRKRKETNWLVLHAIGSLVFFSVTHLCLILGTGQPNADTGSRSDSSILSTMYTSHRAQYHVKSTIQHIQQPHNT